MRFWCGPIAFYVVFVWPLDRTKTELTLPNPKSHIPFTIRGCGFGKVNSVLVWSCVVLVGFIFPPSAFGAVLCAFGVVLCVFGVVRKQCLPDLVRSTLGCGKVRSRIRLGPLLCRSFKKGDLPKGREHNRRSLRTVPPQNQSTEPVHVTT